ncbi:TATA box-binding protein-associated factor RNA polymerase I subunit B-like [Tasmannia lanceolata]|uniref:TATA box-binding protein-associated factor RNA polymerase I subunit B-like n=1 Tax=Tasmannia lanceolata TaxID=3420 RepID=UPI00406468C5
MSELDSIDCDNCGLVGFEDGEDGFFYCRSCGYRNTELMDMVSQGDQYNPHYHSPRAKTLILDKKKTNKEEKPYSSQDELSMPLDFGNKRKNSHPEDVETLANGVRMPYVQGIQLMIQKQCEVLVEKFGVSAMICGVTGTIWLRFLASSRVFDENWANDVIVKSEVAGKEEDEKERKKTRKLNSDRYRGEPRNLEGERAVMIWFNDLTRRIPRASSLAICYLACHIARHDILPTDFLKWEIEGKLPYLAAHVDIEKHFGTPSRAWPLSLRTLFRPCRAIGAWQLESLAGSIAEQIGLLLPPVNFYAIARRYLKELSLPIEKILPHALKIFQWNEASPDLWLSANPSRLPTRVCVMSILIFAIRILYDINGFGKWEMGLSNISTLPSTSSSHTPSSELDIAELFCKLEKAYEKFSDRPEYSKDLHSYLKYCKDVVFAGLTTSYEEDSIIEQLWNLFENEEDIKLAEDSKMRCNDLNKRCSRDGHISVHDEIFQDNVHVGNINNSDNPSRWSQGSKCSSSSKDGNPPTGHSSTTPDRALGRLKANMDENGFIYIPPRKPSSKKEGYLQYARKREDGKLKYVAHADYYILLRACARLVGVDVRIMHLGMLKLEKRLLWIEDRIDVTVQSLPELIDKFGDL